jgi:hypothetical protein
MLLQGHLSVKDRPRDIDIANGMINEVLMRLSIGPDCADSDGWIILETLLKQYAGELNQVNISLLCYILILCYIFKFNIFNKWSIHSTVTMKFLEICGDTDTHFLIH